VSVLSLGLLPLTFGYAIFRYRLMDVIDLQARHAYTLAAAAIVGLYFAGVASIAELVHTRVPSSGPYGLMIAVVVTALLFDPVRKWIQEKLDQYFFRTGYDYRRTLIEFGRELSSETDLDKMLSSLVDRLARTLLVDRIAIFLANSDSSRFELSKSFGIATSPVSICRFWQSRASRTPSDISSSRTRTSCRARMRWRKRRSDAWT